MLDNSLATEYVGCLLSNKHLADLRKSGLTDVTIKALGWYTEHDPAKNGQSLGWKGPANVLGSCLVLSFHDMDGRKIQVKREYDSVDFVRLKPDVPKVDGEGRSAKYLSPKGAPNHAFMPPGTRRDCLSNSSIPLIITEGEKKSAKADQEGFRCVGITGVWNWQRPRAFDEKLGKKTGPRKLIPDLDAVSWEGRPVFICFDSDIADKEEIQWAEYHLAKVLKKEDAVVKVIRIPAGPEGAKQGLDDFLVRQGADAFRRLIEEAKPLEEPKKKTKKADEKPLSGLDLYMDIAEKQCKFWSEGRQAFATVGRLSYSLDDPSFSLWLGHQYRKISGKHAALGDTLGAAITQMKGQAIFDSPKGVSAVRLARVQDTVYLYLADENVTVIEIDQFGWRECESPPVKFLHPSTMQALPMPQRGGNLQNLRRFVNVGTEDNFVLMVGWLTSCFSATGPFSLLTLMGEEGSSKSTTARVFKRLTDPSAADVRAEPENEEDFWLTATRGWTLAFDNLSHLPKWLSDSFCRLATNAAYVTRQKYAAKEETVFQACRPVVLNGIDEFAHESDLRNRCLMIYLPHIPKSKRKRELTMWADFEKERPYLLGAILDRVSGAIRESKNLDQFELERMADFAFFCVAAERGAREDPRFLQAFEANLNGAREQVLDDAILTEPILTLMASRDRWVGTASELLQALTQLANGHAKAQKWPKSPRHFSSQLRRLAPSLRNMREIEVDFDCQVSRQTARGIVISRSQQVLPKLSQNLASAASAASAEQIPAQKSPLFADARAVIPASAAHSGTAQNMTADASVLVLASAENASKSRAADAADGADANFPRSFGDAPRSSESKRSLFNDYRGQQLPD